MKLMSSAAPHQWSLHIVGKGREEGWREGGDESEMYSPPSSLPSLPPLFSSLLCSLHLSYLPLDSLPPIPISPALRCSSFPAKLLRCHGLGKWAATQKK